MKKKKSIGFILIFLLGFILASVIFGFGRSEYNKMTDTVVTQEMGAVSEMPYYEAFAVDEEAAEMEFSTSSSYGDVDSHASLNSVNDVENRKLIKTYNLSYETESFDEAKAQLEQLMNLTGAYAENADLSVATWNNDCRNYYLTIRVPTDKTEAFLKQSDHFGTLISRTEQIEDVTFDYVDVEARKKSLQVEYDRVVELLKEAEDLEQILLLESKLSDLRYQIDGYESRLRTYDNLIDYAKVYLAISEVEREMPKSFGERISAGFSMSIENLRNFFTDLIVFVVSNILTITVVIVVIWIGIVIGRKILKRYRKNKIEIIEDK